MYIQVRGSRLSLGDAVFVRSANDTALFRFGNIEGDSGEALLISFRGTGFRRDRPEAIVRDDVLLASELQTHPPAAAFVKGELLLKYDPPHSVRTYLFESTADARLQLKDVLPVRRSDGGTWQAAGNVERIVGTELFCPELWRRICFWQYSLPADPLFGIIATKLGLDWSFDGAALLDINGTKVPVNAKLTILNHDISVSVTTNAALALLVGNVTRGGTQWLDPSSSSPEYWRLRSFVNGAHFGFNAETGYRGSIDLLSGGFTMSYDDTSPIVATRETFCGVPIAAWSDPILRPEAPLPALGPQYVNAPSSIQLQIFGRRAILYEPPANGDASGYTSVLHTGEPLSEHQHSVLSAFLGYVTGGRSRNVVTETFAIDRKLRVEIQDRGESTKRRSPPIPIHRATEHARMITAQLPDLLAAFDRWRTIDVHSFEAVFHHYAEGCDSNYPVTRILRLAVALEAFINLVTQDSASNEDIVDPDVFKALLEHLLTSYDEYTQMTEPQTFTRDVNRRFNVKLNNLNKASNTRRIKAFWRAVPIRKSKSDDELMRRLRNNSVHQGFVSLDNSEEGLLRMLRDAERLTDLVNRAILTYAGYEGPVLSAKDGSWIQALSGEPFPVPAPIVSPRPNLQLLLDAVPMNDVEMAVGKELSLQQSGILSINVGK